MKIVWRYWHFYKKTFLVLEKCVYSNNYISTMPFNYTQMKMAYLSRTSPNLSSIGEVCDRLGKTFLTSLVGNPWATGGLRVKTYAAKGGLILFPLFLLEGNAILPMTPKTDCETVRARELQFLHNIHHPHMCNMSRVTCLVSHVICHVSHARCNFQSIGPLGRCFL